MFHPVLGKVRKTSWKKSSERRPGTSGCQSRAASGQEYGGGGDSALCPAVYGWDAFTLQPVRVQHDPLLVPSLQEQEGGRWAGEAESGCGLAPRPVCGCLRV